MASLTKKMKRSRKNKRVRAGRVRKRALRKYGSTPAFPIHVDEPHRKPAPAGASRKPGPAKVARIALKSVPAPASGRAAAVKEKVQTGSKPDPRSE